MSQRAEGTPVALIQIAAEISREKKKPERTNRRDRERVWRSTLAMANELLDQHGEEVGLAPEQYSERIVGPVEYQVGDTKYTWRLRQIVTTDNDPSWYEKYVKTDTALELMNPDGETIGNVFHFEQSAIHYPSYGNPTPSIGRKTLVRANEGRIATLEQVMRSNKAMQEFRELANKNQSAKQPASE